MTTFFSNIKTISIHDKNKAQIRNEAIEAYNAKQRIIKKCGVKRTKNILGRSIRNGETKIKTSV